MSLRDRELSSWAERQKEFYRVFPHAHLQFNPESIYAQNIVNELFKHANLTPGKRILEVGCGSGRFTLHLTYKGLNLTALDFSEEQLNKLRKTSQQLGLNADQLSIQTGDITTSTNPFEGDLFDCILGFFFLHHLEDIRSSLKSLNRMLKNGGEVIFIEPNRLNPLFFAQIFFCKDMTWRDEKGTFRYGAQGYTSCLEDSGYCEIKIRKFGFFPPQILDKFPSMLRIEKRLEKFPLVKIFLPFLLIRAKKSL